MSATQSIADTALGLSAAELQILRTQQQNIAQRIHQDATVDPSDAAGRHSRGSSRAVSITSAHSLQGRVSLDPSSLQNLQSHLESVVRAVEGRIDDIQDAVDKSVRASQSGAGRSVKAVDGEIARMRRAIAEIDRLEEDVERIHKIRRKVNEIRIQVDKMGERVSQQVPSATIATTARTQMAVHGTRASAQTEWHSAVRSNRTRYPATSSNSDIVNGAAVQSLHSSGLSPRQRPAQPVTAAVIQPVEAALAGPLPDNWGLNLQVLTELSTPERSQRAVEAAYVCESCRETRKSCDGRRPMCHSCSTDGIACSYLSVAVPARQRASSPAALVPMDHLRSFAWVTPHVGAEPIDLELGPLSHHERDIETSSSSAVPNANETDSPVNESSNTSVDSTVESEGELSFIYGTNSEAMYAFSGHHRLPFLCGQLASLILRAFFDGRYRGRPTQTEDSSARSKSRHKSRNSVISSSAHMRKRGNTSKRPFQDQRDSGNSEGSDDERNAKRLSRTASTRGSRPRFFACPYYRYDVGRYSELNVDEVCYRGCSSACLRDISRLKQHLYRVHRQPEYYCGSCYVVLKEQAELNAHTRQRPACENVEPQFQEKMDREQFNAIKRRNVGREAHAEWFNIYKILFPNKSPPQPSLAYADGDSNAVIQDFVEYFDHEAPGTLSALLLNELQDRISLDEHRRDILIEAVGQASSRFVSLLRPRLNRLVLARSQTRTEVETSVLLLGVGARSEQMPRVSNVPAIDNGDFDADQQLPALDHTLNANFLNVDFEMEPWFDFSDVGQE